MGSGVKRAGSGSGPASNALCVISEEHLNPRGLPAIKRVGACLALGQLSGPFKSGSAPRLLLLPPLSPSLKPVSSAVWVVQTVFGFSREGHR